LTSKKLINALNIKVVGPFITFIKAFPSIVALYNYYTHTYGIPSCRTSRTLAVDVPSSPTWPGPVPSDPSPSEDHPLCSYSDDIASTVWPTALGTKSNILIYS